MKINSKFCQINEFEVRRSPITGKAMKLNLSATKCLVEPEKVFGAKAIAQEWIAMALSPQATIKRPNKVITDALRAFTEIESIIDFAQKIDRLMDVGCKSEKSPGQKNHIYGWLFRLWFEGIIAIPKEFPFSIQSCVMGAREAPKEGRH